MRELECDHLWVKSEDQDDPKCERQQCRRCGDVRFIRHTQHGDIVVNGTTKAVHSWEDDGGLAGD